MCVNELAGERASESEQAYNNYVLCTVLCGCKTEANGIRQDTVFFSGRTSHEESREK